MIEIHFKIEKTIQFYSSPGDNYDIGGHSTVWETGESDDGCGPRERWLHAADELDRFYGRIWTQVFRYTEDEILTNPDHLNSDIREVVPNWLWYTYRFLSIVPYLWYEIAKYLLLFDDASDVQRTRFILFFMWDEEQGLIKKVGIKP
jgi:hypothetical protein